MPFDVGFNFRASSGYVADGAGETYVLGADAYPTTRGGATFGWVSGFSAANVRDRNAAVDRRLAGVHFVIGTIGEFRLDLPAAGQYQIYAAFGDYPNHAEDNLIQFEFLDDAAELFASSAQTADNQRWVDATDVLRDSAASWVADNAARTETFATAVFRCRINPLAVAGAVSVISHLRLVQVGGGFNPAWAAGINAITGGSVA